VSLGVSRVSELLQSLFQSGRVADILLAVMAIEAAVLIGYRIAKGRGFAIPYVITNLVAGGFLVLALKSALTDAPWVWTALSLAAAGISHAIDLAVRWPAT
jgi:hypothetical protein